MIDQILVYITEELNSYLGRYFDNPAGLAKIGILGVEGETDENKMVVSLLNIEREGAMGTTASFHGEGQGFVQKMSPWYLNIYFVVAAVFQDKRYMDSVKMLTTSISYLQQHPVVVLENGQKFAIELVTLSIQELTNVWSILGGKYYPSVVCKVRMLRFEGEEIRKTAGRVKGR